MSKRSKLLSKAENSPNNFRFEDFCKLVEYYGWTFTNQTGSHRFYSHPDLPTLNLQPVNGKAKPYQINQFLQHIEGISDDE